MGQISIMEKNPGGRYRKSKQNKEAEFVAMSWKKTWKTAGWILLAAVLCLLNMRTVYAATEQVQITSCVITDDQNVQITAVNTGTISGDDNHFYLKELKPYEDSVETAGYVQAVDKGSEMVFTFPLNAGTADSRLYSKFVVTVWDGSKYVAVSAPHYITNPEKIADNQAEFHEPLSKKGLLIEHDMLDDAFALGVKHTIVNIPFQAMLGTGIDYEYEGKTYHFSKDFFEIYDKTIFDFSAKGITVTAVILNSWSDSTPDLIYPGTQKTAAANYYMFNAATQAGYEDIKAMASFLAERYSGGSYGKISNWIIGNEINNQQWNYIGPMDVNQYMQEYERAFRVFYTAIKSTNANDRVYFSVDYNWNNEINGTTKYGAKEVIDTFNALVTAKGQMDWGLAYHPYSVPLTEPEFWDDNQTGLISWQSDSPIVNFSNLQVLTDYFQQSQLLNANGEVRHIILSEQGFTSQSATRGECEDLQAAAFAYAYYIADSNPYIDAFIMSRQVDAISEAELSCAFGLWTCDMDAGNRVVPTGQKKIWEVFRYIDKVNKSLEVTEFAKDIIGIEKWGDVIPDFIYRNRESRS